jgi:SAM-dependent methyltransferase
MGEKKDWNKRYDEKDMPWDSGFPDTALINLITSWPQVPGKVLDIGCGTGTNAVWLAQQGIEVTGLDISTSAIALAEQRQAEQEVDCCFLAEDFLSASLEPNSFDLIFDRGCFHCIPEEEQQRYVEKATTCLLPKGLWFSLIGNKDQDMEDKGPPRMTAAKVCSLVEPAFEILSLKSVLQASNKFSQPLRFWHCLMRMR